MSLCSGPWIALFIVAMGIASGVAVNSVVVLILAGLCSRTIPCASGTESKISSS
ncbi:hypothetical protein [Planctomicrobium sp. SH527]|uniref:hypothetical protein n=1 Tax=Planctomicrobium sp. SH527 TaxID=3448123 RepID=UPI003F5C6E84